MSILAVIEESFGNDDTANFARECFAWFKKEYEDQIVKVEPTECPYYIRDIERSKWFTAYNDKGQQLKIGIDWEYGLRLLWIFSGVKLRYGLDYDTDWTSQYTHVKLFQEDIGIIMTNYWAIMEKRRIKKLTVEIVELNEVIKSLRQEIEHLRYKPEGSGYLQAKEEFYKLTKRLN